jgi:hypothetical protein
VSEGRTRTPPGPSLQSLIAQSELWTWSSRACGLLNARPPNIAGFSCYKVQRAVGRLELELPLSGPQVVARVRESCELASAQLRDADPRRTFEGYPIPGPTLFQTAADSAGAAVADMSNPRIPLAHAAASSESSTSLNAIAQTWLSPTPKSAVAWIAIPAIATGPGAAEATGAASTLADDGGAWLAGLVSHPNMPAQATAR